MFRAVVLTTDRGAWVGPERELIQQAKDDALLVAGLLSDHVRTWSIHRRWVNGCWTNLEEHAPAPLDPQEIGA